MAQYLGRPREETEYAYNHLDAGSISAPAPEGRNDRTTLEAIKKNTPKAAGANAASYIDTSIVDQLIKEGFYK